MDLRFAGRPVPPLAALDESGLVVQLVSFSKSLFPGVRVGAVVARGRAVEALLALKQATDLGGALPLQAALADFVAERRLRPPPRVASAASSAAAATRCSRRLARELPGGRRAGRRPRAATRCGSSSRSRLDTRDVFADAARAGVLVAPGPPVPLRRPPVARPAPHVRRRRRGRDPPRRRPPRRASCASACARPRPAPAAAQIHV